MDNFQNNNMNNENQQNSFSYNYGQNDTVNATGHVVEEKPKKKKKVFKRVIAFAVCAAVISAGSIQAYRYIDDNFSFENFFSRGSSQLMIHLLQQQAVLQLQAIKTLNRKAL